MSPLASCDFAAVSGCTSTHPCHVIFDTGSGSSCSHGLFAPRPSCSPIDGKTMSKCCSDAPSEAARPRSEEHTSELQSRSDLVCRLLLEKKKTTLLNRLENLHVDHPNENPADILECVANRKGGVPSMDHHATRLSIEAIIPTAGLICFET